MDKSELRQRLRRTRRALDEDRYNDAVAALGALAGLVATARLVGGRRSTVLLVGAGYGLPLLVLSQFRPEGDLVVAEDVWGLTLLGGAALVVTLGVAVPFPAYDGPTATALVGPTTSPGP